MSEYQSLKSILQLERPPGQEWAVMVYCLIDPEAQGSSSEKGSSTEKGNRVGMVICLGVYATDKEAYERGEKIIEKTGSRFVSVVPVGTMLFLDRIPAAESQKKVYLDEEGKLLKKVEEDERRVEDSERRERERRAEVQKLEDDPTNFHYFAHHVINVIQNEGALQDYDKNVANLRSRTQERILKIREHYRTYPEHEETFIQYLKNRGHESGDIDLYLSLVAKYQEIRARILGLEGGDVGSSGGPKGKKGRE